jgi:chromosome segregation ATPase
MDKPPLFVLQEWSELSLKLRLKIEQLGDIKDPQKQTELVSRSWGFAAMSEITNVTYQDTQHYPETASARVELELLKRCNDDLRTRLDKAQARTGEKDSVIQSLKESLRIANRKCDEAHSLLDGSESERLLNSKTMKNIIAEHELLAGCVSMLKEAQKLSASEFISLKTFATNSVETASKTDKLLSQKCEALQDLKIRTSKCEAELNSFKAKDIFWSSEKKEVLGYIEQLETASKYLESLLAISRDQLDGKADEVKHWKMLYEDSSVKFDELQVSIRKQEASNKELVNK